MTIGKRSFRSLDLQILAVVTASAQGNVTRLHLPADDVALTVDDTSVTLSAPWHLRSRACGLCGDFDQVVVDAGPDGSIAADFPSNLLDLGLRWKMHMKTLV